MSAIQAAAKSLPRKPSEEFLRKEAKRLARDDAMQLAAAQRQLAHEYGYRNWAELITAVRSMASASGTGSGDPGPSQPPPPTSEGAPNVFPLLPLRGLVTFPHVSFPIFVGRRTSINAVQYVIDRKCPIVLATQRDAVNANPSSADMYQVGTLARVIRAMPLPDGTIKAIFEATGRVLVSRFIFDDDFSKAEAAEIAESPAPDARLESLVPSVILALVSKRAKTFGEGNPEAWAVPATTADEASALADRIASELQMDIGLKQALLELLDPAERLEKLLAYLNASS